MKKILSLFLSAVIAVSVIPSMVSADTSAGIDTKATPVTLGYSDDVVFYYEDDYFKNDAYEYNPSLSTMSLGLALSATHATGEDVDFVGGAAGAVDFMTQMGFDSFGWNEWYDKKPTTDSMGVCCGAKVIEDFTLVAVAIRGGGYGAEWASNFLMGPDGTHKGFEDSRNIVLEYLDQYLCDNNIEGNVKFWVTGYSRGAAVANLVGAALDCNKKFTADVSYTREGIYTYTFETPRAGLKSIIDERIETVDGEYTSQYFNIFNIVNPNDLVCYVAPATDGFGFSRYGMDLYLPSAETTADYGVLRERMLNIYSDTLGMPYMIDQFEMKTSTFDLSMMLSNPDAAAGMFGGAGGVGGAGGAQAGNSDVTDVSGDLTDSDVADTSDTNATGTAIDTFSSAGLGMANTASNFGSQSIFLREFIDRVAMYYATDRAGYVANMETGITTMFGLLLGSAGEEQQAFSAELNETFSSLTTEDYINIFGPYIYGDKLADFIGKGQVTGGERFGELMVDAVKKAGITGYTDEQIKACGNLMLDLIVYFLLEDADVFATLTSNLGNIMQAHDPMLCYSWLATMDGNYYKGVLPHMTNGDYRLLKVFNADEVTVTDSTGKVVAKCNNGTVILEDSTIISGTDLTGHEFQAVLPTNVDYSVEISGSDQGSAIIAEFNAFSNKYTRIANYQGELTGLTLPKYYANEATNYSDSGSHAVYKYYGNGMVYSNDFQGAYINKAYVTLKVDATSRTNDFANFLGVDTSGLIGGRVNGGGTYMLGEFVKIDAYNTKGYDFDSWTVNGSSISYSSPSMLYILKEDTNIEAVFKMDVSFNGCSHRTKIAKNFQTQNCNREGYSGDIYCTSCGELISNGISTAKIAHKYVNGICVYCQNLSPDYKHIDDLELFPEEAENLAQILEAERLEAERLEKERLEAERLEAERLEAEGSEADSGDKTESDQAQAQVDEETTSDKPNRLILGIFIAVGVICVGTSAGVFVAMKRRKKERED